MKTKKTLLKGGLLVTMNKAREFFVGDVLIENNRIAKVAKKIRSSDDMHVVDVSNHFVIPGLIQTHTHLCQTLFRGDADDLALLDWLSQRIWPMENAHTQNSLKASAQVGLLEMLKGGTTSILDMGTVRHTHALLETAKESGIRYWGGKCLMDLKGSAGPLYESTRDALTETQELMSYWSRQDQNSLITYVLCPRFAVSCTEQILRDCVELQQQHGLIIHTHASENRDEIAMIVERTGHNNVEYFDKIKMLNPKTVVVHGVHLTTSEVRLMADAGSPLVHCPSSNLKLGSGVAPIDEYLRSGLTVSLGADGAPCNNSMDAFIEMRLAALIQKPIFGPEALSAEKAFEMATIMGAKTLGAEDILGSLEPGKQADIAVVRRDHPSVATVHNPYSALVYSCLGRDVRHVWVAGKQVIKNGRHFRWDENEVLATANAEHKKLAKRL